MTIEELKEVKGQTEEIAKNEIGAHANFDAVDWSADVCGLIDDEIERSKGDCPLCYKKAGFAGTTHWYRCRKCTGSFVLIAGRK